MQTQICCPPLFQVLDGSRNSGHASLHSKNNSSALSSSPFFLFSCGNCFHPWLKQTDGVPCLSCLPLLSPCFCLSVSVLLWQAPSCTLPVGAWVAIPGTYCSSVHVLFCSLRMPLSLRPGPLAGHLVSFLSLRTGMVIITSFYTVCFLQVSFVCLFCFNDLFHVISPLCFLLIFKDGFV